MSARPHVRGEVVAGCRQNHVGVRDGSGHNLLEVVTPCSRPKNRIHCGRLLVEIAVGALYVRQQSRRNAQRTRQAIAIGRGPRGTERRTLLQCVERAIVRVSRG